MDRQVVVYDGVDSGSGGEVRPIFKTKEMIKLCTIRYNGRVKPHRT